MADQRKIHVHADAPAGEGGQDPAQDLALAAPEVEDDIPAGEAALAHK
eukprot:CAMPEP_0179158996 /NCGR_PEP_ID=MMETSP0796-20121207/77612_1 /TAXON_ID=73915 /ORGANISM="Pyrodinium bahamense, Strain pbaha01" /LENGTH=47 /DNA_ID= /DNA_START= /DNA_END= /DNA_ORIENTATION=